MATSIICKITWNVRSCIFKIYLIGDALCKAKKLTPVLKDILKILDFQEASVDTSEDKTTDENIVHRAMGILRRCLKKDKKKAL